MSVAPIDLDPTKTAAIEQISQMSPEERAAMMASTRPRIVEPYFAHIPHPAQQVFLMLNNRREALYGGSAGGGKSDALLMAALQYVDVPGYSALLLRRTWPDLNAPGAILDRFRLWMHGLPVKQKEEGRLWVFPSGARIQFGYIQQEKDKYKFQSAEYQFVGYDELTQFAESQYTYLFSRIRRPSVSCLNCKTSVKRHKVNGRAFWVHVDPSKRGTCPALRPDPKVMRQYQPKDKDGLTVFDVPLRMRGATNPGGYGHQWVKSRFITPETRTDGAVFVPARISDNPSLDQKEYIESLSHMLPVDRERLLNGDWDVEEEGNFFARHWINVVDQAPVDVQIRVRYWDLAATENATSDWTVGTKLALTRNGQWIIEDIVRLQGTPLKVEQTIRQTAMLDGIGVPISMEEEPGSSGKNNTSHYKRNILNGFTFKGVRSTGNKTERAAALSSAAEAGDVMMVKGKWNVPFLDEITLFPGGEHDDQVDATAGAMNDIAFGSRTRILV